MMHKMQVERRIHYRTDINTLLGDNNEANNV